MHIICPFIQLYGMIALANSIFVCYANCMFSPEMIANSLVEKPQSNTNLQNSVQNSVQNGPKSAKTNNFPNPNTNSIFNSNFSPNQSSIHDTSSDYQPSYISNQISNQISNYISNYNSNQTSTPASTQPLILPTESIYYLTSPEIGRHKLSTKTHSPVHIFANAEQLLANLRNYSSSLPSYLPSLLTAFAPGPLQFLVNNFENQPIIAYIPDNTAVLNLALNEPVVCVPVRSKFGIPLSNFGQMKKYFPNALVLPNARYNYNSLQNNSFNTINSETNLEKVIDEGFEQVFEISGVEPTLLDCRSYGQINILRAGQIPKSELIKVVPVGVEINESRMRAKVRTRVKNLDLKGYLGARKNKIVVVGTREKLSEQFGLQKKGHFHRYELGRYTLVSLGSQTATATIAKSLTKNLQIAFEIAEFNEAELYLLQQPWGHTFWSKVIDYYLNLGFLKSVGQLQIEG